jgi:hypothetical protein
MTSLIGKNGRIVLPQTATGFKVGQRIFFGLEGRSVRVSRRPQGVNLGRILSTRVSRCSVRSKLTKTNRLGQRQVKIL